MSENYKTSYFDSKQTVEGLYGQIWKEQGQFTVGKEVSTMWIRHPQTGRSMQTDGVIKVRCDDCRKQYGYAPRIDRIKIVKNGNREKLVYIKYHLQFYKENYI